MDPCGQAGDFNFHVPCETIQSQCLQHFQSISLALNLNIDLSFPGKGSNLTPRTHSAECPCEFLLVLAFKKKFDRKMDQQWMSMDDVSWCYPRQRYFSDATGHQDGFGAPEYLLGSHRNEHGISRADQITTWDTV